MVMDNNLAPTMLEQLVRQRFGIEGAMTRLAGENENYQITASNGTRYVMKITEGTDAAALIEMEHAAVDAVAAALPGLALPRLVPTTAGEFSLALPGANPRFARLLTFVDGNGWFDDPPCTPAHWRELGGRLACVALALAPLSAVASHRTHRWDLARASQHRCHTAVIDDRARRKLIDDIFWQWCAVAEPKLSALSQGLIHGDLNDDNLRLRDGRLTGLLDFGDCIHNPIVADLAIALAYLILGQEDPLDKGADLVAGYHALRPLSAIELELLFPMICVRLATSVITSAERRRIDPDRAAWFVTEERAWQFLDVYASLDPVEATRKLAAGTGAAVHAGIGAPRSELMVRRAARFSGALSLSYSEPVRFVRGEGQYLFDEQGRAFLDLYNNVCHVGHCHPHVVAAAHAQMARLNTNTRYLYDGLVDYADRLCATLPPALEVCFFVNSGSEANELALRLAKVHTGRRDMLVVENAYHGHTAALIDISPYKFMGPGGAGLPPPGVHVLPIPDGYRGVYKGQGVSAGRAYGDEVGRVVAAGAQPVAGFLCESLISCGGQVIPPQGYFATAFEHVRRAGGVCMLDEVQVGFGRTGSHFWAFETQDVVPDIVVMGKPIGNGHPMAAVVTTRAIADSFAAAGMEFFATCGGNPVSCAVGMAVLDVIRDEGLQAHAKEMGALMIEGLRGLQQHHALIGDVRGIGLFVGIELVRDRNTLAPANVEAARIVNALRQRHILTGTDGPFGNVIKIKPPMVVNRHDVAMFIECLDDVLRAF